MKLTSILAASGLMLTGLLAFTPTASACYEEQPWCAMIYVCTENLTPAWDFAMCEAGYALAQTFQVVDYVRCEIVGGPACPPPF